MSLQDRVAIVTGAGSGIGRAVAQMMAARGGAVAVMDLDANSAAETARLIVAAGGGLRAIASTSAAATRSMPRCCRRCANSGRSTSW